MANIKVLIVEDQLLIAEDIAERLKKHSLEVAGICTSGEEAIKVVQTEKPDLILMDIELSDAMDGISTAQVILQQQFIPIIYLSNYMDQKTVERAKKTQPASYLTKPFNEADLIRAIDLAFSNANAKAGSVDRSATKDKFFLRTQNQVYVKILLSDILYLKAGRAYCSVVTKSRTYTLANSMNHIHEQLHHRDLQKIHRSYVVNVNQITELDGNVVKIGEVEVQMSKEYREALLGQLKIVK